MAQNGLELTPYWHLSPPDAKDIPVGVCVIQCDASHKKGIHGTGVLIKFKDKEFSLRGRSGRSKGPVQAELIAIKNGFIELKKAMNTRAITQVLIYSDNSCACDLINRVMTPHLKHIIETTQEIQEIISQHEHNGIKVHVQYTRARNQKRVDRRAAREREEAEKKVDSNKQKRIERISSANERSKSVHIIARNGTYYASSTNGGPLFKVCIDPPSCECAHWQNKYSGKPPYVLARASPCLHICALANYLGADILEIFDKQINRVN